MTISANVILDSRSPDGVRLTTLEVRIPRIMPREAVWSKT
jgi:hypothetical protein